MHRNSSARSWTCSGHRTTFSEGFLLRQRHKASGSSQQVQSLPLDARWERRLFSSTFKREARDLRSMVKIWARLMGLRGLGVLNFDSGAHKPLGHGSAVAH